MCRSTATNRMDRYCGRLWYWNEGSGFLSEVPMNMFGNTWSNSHEIFETNLDCL